MIADACKSGASCRPGNLTPRTGDALDLGGQGSVLRSLEGSRPAMHRQGPQGAMGTQPAGSLWHCRAPSVPPPPLAALCWGLSRQAEKLVPASSAAVGWSPHLRGAALTALALARAPGGQKPLPRAVVEATISKAAGRGR